MKILFICGCLEIGKDGVGDYTRLLSTEINKHGQQSIIIGINDFYINELIENKINNGSEQLRTIRIPSITPWNLRMDIIEKWIKNFKPDWISLQYVTFSFHKKGLPYFLARRLKDIASNTHWHIMFHELWVRDGPMKFKVLGRLQKSLIKRMIEVIDAKVIHTHLPLYFKDLETFRIKVFTLPLFSNFPDLLPECNLNSQTLKIGFFNLVELDDNVMRFLKAFKNQADIRNLNFEIILIGGAADRIQNFGETLENMDEFRFKVKYTGFLNTNHISEVLKSCTLGITPLFLSTIGKSGTSAAFLSHGIPVAVPNQDLKAQPFFNQELSEALLLEPNLDRLDSAKKAAIHAKSLFEVSHISKLFLDDLKQSK